MVILLNPVCVLLSGMLHVFKSAVCETWWPPKNSLRSIENRAIVWTCTFEAAGSKAEGNISYNYCRRYKGSCPRPEAQRLRPWCHPSMSLFVLTAFLNTVQSDGLQVVPLIQLLATYSVKGCNETGAWRWRRLNIGRISFSGRKGSASIFLMKWRVPRSWL